MAASLTVWRTVICFTWLKNWGKTAPALVSQVITENKLSECDKLCPLFWQDHSLIGEFWIKILKNCLRNCAGDIYCYLPYTIPLSKKLSGVQNYLDSHLIKYLIGQPSRAKTNTLMQWNENLSRKVLRFKNNKKSLITALCIDRVHLKIVDLSVYQALQKRWPWAQEGVMVAYSCYVKMPRWLLSLGNQGLG